MKVKTRLLQTCLSLLSLASLAFLSPAFAATPVAVWDNNFDDPTNGGWTLDLNGNTANQVTDGDTTTNSLTITETGGGVTFTPSSNFTKVSVIIRCSGLDINSEKDQVLFSLKSTANVNERVGSYLKASDNTLRGLWNNGLYNNVTGPALSTSPSTLAFAYDKTSGNNVYGTRVFSISTGEDTKSYIATGLKSGSDTYKLLAIGGICGTSTTLSVTPATNMTITAVAIFDSQLTQAEVEAYKFPSEIKEFTASASIEGEKAWGDITFNEGTWTSSENSTATLTLSGDATITLPDDFQAATVTVNGAYKLTLKGGKSYFELVGSDLTAVERDVFYLTSVAQTIAANHTYIVGDSVTLSGNNTVAAGGTLKVTNGTATVAFASTGITGTVEISEGATLAATSSDALNYNNAAARVNVYGTLNMGTARWTCINEQLNLYGNGAITGTGDSAAAIDLFTSGAIVAHKADSADDGTTPALAPSITAPVRYRGANVITVEEGVTLSLGTGRVSSCQSLAKKGAGTLTLTASAHPFTTVEAGTLELACDSALSGTTTVSAGATLKVSAGTHDLTSHTNNGTVEVAGGTVTVSSSIGGTVNWTDGTLKVKLTATETANGLTLGTNFTLKENANVTFIESDGTAKEGTGGTYEPDPITWKGGETGAWSDADNWSRAITETAVVKLDCENVAITVASTDTMPSALVVSGNATLSGEMTFASCAVTEGATLTIDGTATVTALSDAGNLVLNEGATIAPPSGGSLADFFANWTGVVKGKGALKYTSLPGDSAVQTYLQNAEKWQATIAFENLQNLTSVNLNLYGNSSSTIRMTGCSMYFIASNSSTTYRTFAPTLELCDGTYGYGVKVTDGHSGDLIEFTKLTGDGTFLMLKDPKRRFFFPGLAEFKGALNLQGQATMFLGRGREGYTYDVNTDNGKIVVACEIPAAMSITNTVGNILFQDGATLTVANTETAKIKGKSCEMDSGATVTLKTSLTTLTDVTSLPFVAWTTKPTSDLAFTIDNDTLPAKRWRLSQKSTGLYVVRKYGTMILVK